MTASPASKPQKALPMPASVNPEAVTRKVTSAASRDRSSPNAAVRLLPIVPNRAMPEMAATSPGGNAPKTLATVAPSSPVST